MLQDNFVDNLRQSIELYGDKPYENFLSPLKWDGSQLLLLDQRKLPFYEEWVSVKTLDDAYLAIKNMIVRGAPAIGIVGAFGLFFAIKELVSYSKNFDISLLHNKANYLIKARPTAVNLRWAVEKVLNKIIESAISTSLLNIIEEFVLNIWKDDILSNLLIGTFGRQLVPKSARILTHCNAGAIATGGYGTALGVIKASYQEDNTIHVFATETRPWLQGARLTAWELNKLNIPVTLIIDSCTATLMANREIDLVIVGADRITKNGDVANKIGTYMLAVLAKYHNIPFYVAAPSSTFDLKLTDGHQIPIEERSKDEVIKINNLPITIDTINVKNPVFDLTPNELITAIITEKGILYPPYSQKINQLCRN